MHCTVIQMFEMVLISLQMSTYGDYSADFGFIPVVDVDRYVKVRHLEDSPKKALILNFV